MTTLPYLRTGSGPTLVLQHGYLGGSAQWVNEINVLSRHFDVIAPDLPGFGEASDMEGCVSINGMARSVLALLDELEVSEFSLMGHSMGGMIAQEIAAMRPQAVEKLVLYGTGPLGLMPNRFEPITASRERLIADGVAETIKRIGATWFKDGARAQGHALLSKIGAKANPEAALAALKAMADWDGRSALERLVMPTLVIWGDSDKSYRWPQVETLWENIPNAQLSVVPATAHAVHLEKPRLFQAIVEDFLLQQ